MVQPPAFAHHSLAMFDMTNPVTVKLGDMITCTGGPAKSGAKTMRCTTVELSSGEKLRS